MASSNNLDALFADGELPFGHPGRRFDGTPEYFNPSPLMNQEPERDYMPDGDDTRVHYAPGDHPLCGTESMTAVYTDDPALVAGCADCLERPTAGRSRGQPACGPGAPILPAQSRLFTKA